GLAVLLAENILGSSTHAEAVNAFKKMMGRNWVIIGVIGVFSSWCIYSFYSVVGGWTIGYTIMAATGELNITDSSELTGIFTRFISDPLWPILAHLVFAGLTCFVVLAGVQRGLEKAVKIMMPLLFIIMIILIIVGISLPGSSEGLKLFLYPDFSKLTPQGVLDALGLAFFSLSIGLGIHITYSAYLADNKTIANSSMWVVILSCLVCVLAGLMIFPALTAAGLEPNAGPGLTFMTMPVYFANLPGGNILAVTFFVLLLMAALTSAISLLEHIVAYVQMRFQWTRRRAGLVVTASIMLMGIPVSLSFGPMSDVTLGGKTLFDLLDYLTSNILMPLFGIAMCLIFGWSRRANAVIPDNITGAKRQCLLLVWRYIGPICIGIILVHGLIG
ncbi:TPA: sodium-dependent transporter, partial [Proteus mirabilis]|nr:sodium-dependent transporter [Proteus mirabilis]